MIKCHFMEKHHRNGQMDRRLFENVLKVDFGLCTMTMI